MKILRHGISKELCPKCHTGPQYELKFCEYEHVEARNPHPYETDATTFNGPNPQHLHVSCVTCGYERVCEPFSRLNDLQIRPHE